MWKRRGHASRILVVEQKASTSSRVDSFGHTVERFRDPGIAFTENSGSTVFGTGTRDHQAFAAGQLQSVFAICSAAAAQSKFDAGRPDMPVAREPAEMQQRRRSHIRMIRERVPAPSRKVDGVPGQPLTVMFSPSWHLPRHTVHLHVRVTLQDFDDALPPNKGRLLPRDHPYFALSTLPPGLLR